MTADILAMLDGKWEDGRRPKDIFSSHVSERPDEFAPIVVEGLHSRSRKVQNGCAELASLLSAGRPDLLIADVDLFVANLAAKEPVLRWEAVCTLGNLCAVDSTRDLVSSLPALVGFLQSDSIVLQGHAVRALTKMARAYPDQAAMIQDHLLASASRFPGNRVGFIVEAMEGFGGDPVLRGKALAFVDAHQASDIGSVARKARRAVKKLA